MKGEEGQRGRKIGRSANSLAVLNTINPRLISHRSPVRADRIGRSLDSNMALTRPIVYIYKVYHWVI